MSFFTEQEIRDHSFDAVIDPGKRLHRLGRVCDLTFVGDDIIASVKAESLLRVIISREDGSLRFSCSCGYTHAGACEHAVAVMRAANDSRAIQVGIDWDRGSGSAEETDCDSAPHPVGSVKNSFDALPEAEELPEAARIVRDLPVEKPVMRLYLSEQEGMLLVEARYAYFNGMVEFSGHDTAMSRLVAAGDEEVVRVHRSRAREAAFIARLDSFELMRYQMGIYTPTIDPRVWTLQQLALLAEEGFEIYGQENLQSTQARKSEPHMAVSISSGDGGFDCTVTVSFDGIPATLAALVMAIRRRSRFVLLTDGTSGMLPQRWLDTFAALFGALDDAFGKESIRITHALFGAAKVLYDMADERECDEAFGVKMAKLQQCGAVAPQSIPDGFGARLRPYQQAGFDWLCFLREFRFGGCLADDMGLGKTVQALALLLREKSLGEAQPSLVVVPNSLLFNWEREAARFAPSISVLLYHGAARHRYRDILHMSDVVLTTYGTVLRDAETLGGLYFHYIILDEAQAVKNPASLISRSVRSLSAKHRLALSGTPMENNLMEIWSMFSFLNPGMFGSVGQFVRSFVKPIERDMNEETMSVLRKILHPFVLRRTKAQVVRELPPKNEMVVYTEMVPRQRILYDITRQLYYGRISDSIGSAGIERSGLQILEGLLRLRQICCHPLLVEKSYSDDSGKFLMVEQMLRDAVEGGHRVLLFSQFVSALELLRKRCALSGIATELLTGATKNRQQVVDRFQKHDGAAVFLISLKAGGTGLNLTAADYVFHIDPWWNPGAENQATDRAYRIGQNRSVFVYKMVTKDSIEERVCELQEKKRHLVESVIKDEQTFYKQLSKEDLLSLFR